MPALRVHRDFQDVRNLAFCYVCGEYFVEGDEVNRDHVPPKCTFSASDRRLVLKLKTHVDCNSSFKVEDKKVGQLIALRRYERPKTARDFALRFGYYSNIGVAVENLNVDAAVWRWVRAFHAALYGQPLLGSQWSLQTPFPRADKTADGPKLQPILEQHVLAIDVIKTNRALDNVDVIAAYNGKLTYECVWCQADDGERWLCCFGLDIYDWKDLGSHTADIPARGCAGMYVLPSKAAPTVASLDRQTPIIIPNLDRLDPFAP